MRQHDVEITISKSGEVKVHIKGIKGKSCLKFGAFLADVVGKVKSQQMTSEFYEPEEKSGIYIEEKQRE
jgi:hypothetical protein